MEGKPGHDVGFAISLPWQYLLILPHVKLGVHLAQSVLTYE